MPPASIWIVTPPGYAHSGAFEEFALALSEGLRELGVAAPIVHRRPEGETIVLGANLLPAIADRPPRRAILFNLEQLSPGSPWWSERYLDLLRRRPVWDYSARNVALLRSMGIAATLCEVGHADALRRIVPRETPDIDVLFYGSVNDRRRDALRALEDAGLRVVALFGVYGAARDDYIARSRIVLNLHHYEGRLFEVVRVSYLLANGCCVVSESGDDPEAERAYEAAVAFTSYEGIVPTCLALLRDDARRRALGASGLALMQSRRQADALRAAIGQMPGGFAGLG
ncbi:hypothetical protein [Variovorax sp.]|uniref:glycosyltransferase family protein n=1 Tax=Variovorax sp. TaxID=1871043 RepID=UPI00137C9A3C|nr:hypothetical protein [Variovorax sp.]KAF1071544.1 MAG: hypothetical protein GAK39_01166 [Variovorax sp.]